MRISEATAFFGIPTGVVIAMNREVYGPLDWVSATLMGVICGWSFGGLYAIVVFLLMRVLHLGWCDVKNQPTLTHPWAEGEKNWTIGVAIGNFGVLAGWIAFGWWQAVMIATAVGVTTAITAGCRKCAA